ncbi:phenylalanine--tRNA ligase subunit beta [Candidatus Babeliales bacterium]|nr:phenylalanine--tRNA ligase subunit beta [Candidatus Babeliales bacterium]
MKISLSWIFDHIDARWKKQNVDEIVSKFNQITAEIESYEKVKLDLKSFFMGRVISHDKKETVLQAPELKKEITLSSRVPAKIFEPKEVKDLYFLIYKENKEFRWATCSDVGLDKDGVLPAFDMTEVAARGDWKKEWVSDDIILDVDNKSITHRPDLWGHRGLARELAAFLDLNFKPADEFLSDHSIKKFEKKSKQDEQNKFSIEIQAPQACNGFSGVYFKSIENKPCNVFVASRLINVGIRPINGIVDLTNYVMLDWSQPVHAYDAEKISQKKLIARMAQGGEKLVLLDGSELKLTTEDLIIADGEKPVGLAGVMGGLYDSIGVETKSIFFEAASFGASFIRRTALRHGQRTDSSTRFEKTLDPGQVVDSILRFIKLTEQAGIKTEISGDIINVGKPVEQKTISVTHSFLEKRSGVRLEQDEIVRPLTKLGFDVSAESEIIGEKSDVLYTVAIPSFRSSKDIEIKEDILEEVIRFFGLNKIALTLPLIRKVPHDMTGHLRVRKIKNFLCHAACMTEQQNYLYSDEDFLKQIGFDPRNYLEISNPVSENNRRLVTSLLPTLFKNIHENSANENSLRFFEVGRTCHLTNDLAVEKKSVAGIFFEKRKKFDFYEGKQQVNDLLKICDIDGVEWRKIDKPFDEYPWLTLYQSAELFHDGTRIGVAGKVTTSFLDKIDALPESEAFFFELDGNRLIEYRKALVLYTPISKYQGVTFDLSFMVPVTLTVDRLKKLLLDSDILIEQVELIDFFDKAEWAEQRSLAFRVWVSNPEKTLEKEEIDGVRESTIAAAQKVGAELRS